MAEPRFPRWLRILIAVIPHLKNTVGSAAILVTMYLWYFERISQEKAIFGIILLSVGGFITSHIDVVDLFKYLGNYKKKGDDNAL